MNDPRFVPAEKNPLNIVGGAFAQWKKRFSAVAFFGLMMWSAPQLLLLFIDNVPGIYRIDLSQFIAPLAADAELQSAIEAYGVAGLFSIAPLFIAAALVVGIFLTPLFHGCCATLTLSDFAGEKTDTYDILSRSGRRYFKFFGANVCAALAGVVIYIVAAIPSVLSILFANAAFIAGIFSVVSMVAAAGAALIVTALQAMTVTAVADGYSGMRAVMRAWKLLRPRMWRFGSTILLAGVAVNYLTTTVQSLFSAGSVMIGAAVGAIAGGLLAAFSPMCAARCYIAADAMNVKTPETTDITDVNI